MNIGPYTFAEFKTIAEKFHGYAAPGLLLGGYMVELAKKGLPSDTFFEAVVESRKCLPDAVQLLTLCSTGNNWMKVHNTGRYAVSLFDKYTGEGVRVSVDAVKLKAFPELNAWLMKEKPKADQDEELLCREIETAGESVLRVEPIRIKRRFLGHSHMGVIGECPLCGEPYPVDDGKVCRGCQGEAPYVTAGRTVPEDASPGVRVVPLEEAVGKASAHDMTRIEPGVFKEPEFKAGQVISVGDICRLQQMGRFTVAVLEGEPGNEALMHENEAAETLARRMAGQGVTFGLPPSEGKVDFTADIDGLFCVDVDRLREFNLVPDLMAASRQDAVLVSRGAKLAGTRAIPLFIHRDGVEQALDILSDGPLFKVLPLRAAKVGILVTGTEVFQGIIEDKFIPIISAKVQNLGCEVVKAVIAPDEKAALARAVADITEAGADMLITTGGLSVDPDDITRQALLDAGLTDVLHGTPVLPGAMSLIGRMRGKEGDMQVIGVPACALYHKTTFFDLVLPRLLAGREITRMELSRMADGGFCL